MTVSQIKVTVVRKPQLKLKVLPRFPSNVTAESPILLNRTGGNYDFSLNVLSVGVSLQALFLPASGIDASSVISGTFAPARLPTPTAATLGGVKSKTNVSHQWLNSIGTDGLPTSTQPDGLDVTYTQTGTGAVAYTVASKIGQAFSVKDFGAVGDGATNDAVNINKAIVALVAAGGGELYFPRGTYNCNGTIIIADLSALATRFQGRVVVRGEGVASVIQQSISSAPCFKFIASTSNSEAYFELRNIRVLGAATAAAAIVGSKGLEIDVCAFAQIRGVVAEGFEYGIDCTDVEQLEISNCEFRFNKNGGVFRGVGSITDTNSVLVSNTQFTNNSLTGITVNHPNCWVMNGGSVQYNGLVGGASNTGGAFFQEGGTGYGTIVHLGVAFEGNGGIGDFDSLQTTNPGVYSFIGCGFMRTQTFGPTLGYGTNNFNARGTNANTIYRFSGCTFKNAGGYSVSAARPTIALANTSCKIADDGTNYFQSATETLTYPVGQIAAPVLGNVTVGGNLTVGASKLVVTGSTGNAAFAGLIFAAQGMVGGSLANSSLTVAATSSGAPSGDILNLFGSTTNLNGNINITGNLAINTNKLVVTASSGNTAFSGLIFAAQGIVGGAPANSTMTVASTSSGAPSGDILNLAGTTINLNAVPIQGLTTAWTPYTPTLTPSGGGTFTTTTVTCAFKLVGKTVHWRAKVLIVAHGTAAGTVDISLPAGHTLAGDFNPCCNEYASLGVTFYARGASGGTAVTVATATGGAWANIDGRGVSLSGAYDIT